MSTSDVLSKEEVNSLLGDSEEQSSGTNKASQKATHYDLSSQAQKAIEGVARLETIHELFCREASIAASHFLCQKTLLEGSHSEVVTFNEYVGSLEKPMLINYINVKPMDCPILMVFSNKLTANIIEALFGGNVRDNVNNERQFGEVEMRIGKLFVDVLNRSMQKSWSSIKEGLEFEYSKTVLNTSLVSIAEPKESVITAKFDCVFNNIHNELTIMYPQDTISPIKRIFKEAHSSLETKEEVLWHNSIQDSFDTVTVELTAKTAEISVKLQELINFNVGDIVPIENPNHAVIKINDVVAFSGKCSKNAGKRVVMIENRILE